MTRSRITILVACCELVGTSPGLRLDFCPSYGIVEFQNRHCFWKSQDHPIFHGTSGSPSADALNICTSYKGHWPKGQSMDSARTFYTRMSGRICFASAYLFQNIAISKTEISPLPNRVPIVNTLHADEGCPAIPRCKCCCLQEVSFPLQCRFEKTARILQVKLLPKYLIDPGSTDVHIGCP